MQEEGFWGKAGSFAGGKAFVGEKAYAEKQELSWEEGFWGKGWKIWKKGIDAAAAGSPLFSVLDCVWCAKIV